jgi:hypothetical protein
MAKAGGGLDDVADMLGAMAIWLLDAEAATATDISWLCCRRS